MLTESTYIAAQRSAQVEVEELRQRAITGISLGLLVLGYLATWLGPTDSRNPIGRFSIYLSLLVEGIVAVYARARKPFLARAVLLIGPTLSLGGAIVLVGGPLLPCAAVLIVLANIDAHHGQAGVAMVPADLGLPPVFAVEDLLTGDHYDWHIGDNYVRHDPYGSQTHVMRVVS